MANMLGLDTHSMLSLTEPGLIPMVTSQNVNPNLGWEEKKEELRVWTTCYSRTDCMERLMYRRKVDGMIGYSEGSTTSVYARFTVTNIGIWRIRMELETGDIVRTKDWTYTSSINLES